MIVYNFLILTVKTVMCIYYITNLAIYSHNCAKSLTADRHLFLTQAFFVVVYNIY